MMKNVLVSVASDTLEKYINEILLDLGVLSDMAPTFELAQSQLAQNSYDLLISRVEDPAFLNWAQRSHCRQPVLALSLNEIQASLDFLIQLKDVKYIIGQKNSDLEAVKKYVKAGLRKIISQDFFGLEKYIIPQEAARGWVLSSSQQRASVIEDMALLLKKVSVRSSLLDQCGVVAEEMLMNAIYDAPVDQDGRPLFNHLSRTEEVMLDPEHTVRLRMAYDDQFVAISVQDAFGSLTRDILIQYLKACYHGVDSTQHHNKRGAGKGLHQIVENSDLVVFNVQPKKQTEVICFIALGTKQATAKLFPSFQYFSI